MVNGLSKGSQRGGAGHGGTACLHAAVLEINKEKESCCLSRRS
jgi:hypothetical protein